MKFKRIIEISIYRVFRNVKRNLMLSIPVLLIMTLLLIANILQYSMKIYTEKIENNIELRTIDGINYTDFTNEQVISKLKEIPHIDMVVDMYERQIYADQYCEQLKTKTTNGYTNIQPTNEQVCPEVIQGRKSAEGDQYVVILPNKICANGPTNNEYYNVVFEKKNIEEMYINGENLIGSRITIEFRKEENNVFQKTFEVIGIYDSERYVDTETLYIPKTIIKEINKELGHKPEDLFMKIVVDKVENMQDVENILIQEELKSKTGIQSEVKNNKDYSIEEKKMASVTNISLETLNIIKKLYLFFLEASTLILAVLLITSNTNKTYLSTREIGILKVEGYTNKEIQKITIVENIIVCLISIISALIVLGVLIVFVNILANYIIEKDTMGITMNEIRQQIYYIKKIPQKINVIFAIITSILIIMIECLNTFFINKRILAKNIKEILS